MDDRGELKLAGTMSGTLSSDGLSLSGTLTDTGQAMSGSLTIPSAKPAPASYEELTDKPSINAVVIDGVKLGQDYHLQDKMDAATTAEIEAILYLD